MAAMVAMVVTVMKEEVAMVAMVVTVMKEEDVVHPNLKKPCAACQEWTAGPQLTRIPKEELNSKKSSSIWNRIIHMSRLTSMNSIKRTLKRRELQNKRSSLNPRLEPKN